MPGNTTSTTTFRADISSLRQGMQEARRQISLANSEFRAASSGMEDWTRSADGLNAKLRSLDSVLSAQRRQLNILEQELEATTREYGENSAAADRVRVRINNQTAAINRTEREIRDYQSQLDRLENEADSAAREIDDMNDSIDDTDNSSKKASDGFTVMKGALANLVADGIRLAIDALKDLAKNTIAVGASFEQEMAKVGAISGASAEDMQKLNAKAKEMGATTKFSATESAEAFEYMAMAGWETSDMLNGIEGIMNLAAASGEDLANTSDIVTDALTAMGYEAGDAGKLADVMAAASSNANTNVSLMGKTFQYAAPILGTLGMSMEDAAVAIGLMANSGIKGDKAGTALRSTLTRLSAPPAECAKEMERLGISLTDSNGEMRSLDDVMKDMRKAFIGLSEEEQTAAAKHIAGREAMSGLLAIVNASEKDYKKLTKAVKDSGGAAEEMAEKMNNTVSGQATLIKSQIEGIMINAFEKISPALKNALQGASSALTDFEPILQSSVGQMAHWLTDLSDTISSAGGDTLAEKMANMAGLVVGKMAETFVNSVPTIATSVQTFLHGILNALTQVVPNLVNMILSIAPSVLIAVENMGMDILAKVPTFFSTAVKAVLSAIPQLTSTVAKIGDEIIKKVPLVLKNIVSAIPQVVASIGNAVSSESSVLVESFITLFDSFRTAIPQILTILATNLPQIINAVVDFVINAVPELLDASVEMFDAIADALPEVLPDIIAALLNVITKVASTIVSRLPDIVNASVRMLDGIVRGITQIIPKVIAAMPKIALAVTESLIEAMPDILEAAKNMLFGVIYAITEIVPTIAQKVEEIDKAVENGIRQGINVIREAGKDLIRGLWYGISDMAGWIKGKVQEFAGGIVDNLKKTLKIQSPSKVIRDEVGYWMAMAIPAGFDKAYSSVTRRLKLIATSLTGGFVSSLISGITLSNQQAVSASKKTASLVEQIMASAANNFDFTGAAESAASRFSDALSKKVTYLTNRIQYQNEQRLSMFEDDISTLESRLEKETASEEARSQKAIERLEKERDKLISTAEKKQKKAKSEAEKANIKKEIDAVKKRYTKLISAEEKASKKQISSIKKQYETLISEQKKAKDNYEKASAAALQEFDTAMAEYQQNAEALINSTINGVSEKYQAEYDALTNKQENLIEKLKSAGDLFNVSSAGVMTINDIRQQTKNIKEYTEKLQKVKEKVSSELFDEISSYDIKEGSAFMEQILALSDDDLKAYNEAYEEKMRMAESLSESLYDSDFDDLADEYSDSLSEAMEGLPDLLKKLGNSAMQGFVDGLSENTDYMVKNVRTIIDALVDEIKSGLDIHSPSRVLEKLGAYTGGGFGDGLSSMVGYIRGVANDIVDAAKIPIDGLNTSLPQLRSAVLPASTSGATSNIVTNNYNLIQNNTSPKSLSALETYQARRQQLAMLKMAIS